MKYLLSVAQQGIKDLQEINQNFNQRPRWSKLGYHTLSIFGYHYHCLVNPDKEKTVEKAFVLTNELSARLREKYKLD